MKLKKIFTNRNQLLGNLFYECSLSDGKIITFNVPKKETVDSEGNEIFSKEEPSQLLIRWLV
jgi:hypothetical protein